VWIWARWALMAIAMSWLAMRILWKSSLYKT
jgi:hypothetical protein